MLLMGAAGGILFLLLRKRTLCGCRKDVEHVMIDYSN